MTSLVNGFVVATLVTLAAFDGEAAAATTVTRFSGVIGEVLANDGQVLGALNLGDSISGYFTFDDDPAARLGGDRFAAEVGVSLPTFSFDVASNNNYIR